jgi:hypothetical protein
LIKTIPESKQRIRLQINAAIGTRVHSVDHKVLDDARFADCHILTSTYRHAKEYIGAI